MKALTLIQPWATLIAIGAKRIETRSWSTSYRGLLAIHASKDMPQYARDYANGLDAVRKALHESGYATRTQMKLYSSSINGEKWLPAGAIVAICELVNCVRIPILKQLFPVDSRIDVNLTQKCIVIPPRKPGIFLRRLHSGPLCLDPGQYPPTRRSRPRQRNAGFMGLGSTLRGDVMPEPYSLREQYISFIRETLEDPETRRKVAEEMMYRTHNLSRSALGMIPLSRQEYDQSYSFRDWQVQKSLKRLKRKPNHKINRNR